MKIFITCILLIVSSVPVIMGQRITEISNDKTVQRESGPAFFSYTNTAEDTLNNLQAGANSYSPTIITTSISPSTACPGNTIFVQFSSENNLPTTSQGWKLRLTEALYTGEDKPEGWQSDLLATRISDNTLQAVLPTNLKPQFNTPLNVRVLTPDNLTVGERGNVFLQVQLAPSITFSKTDYTIPFGGGTLLNLNTVGSAPFSLTLNDGREYFPGSSSELNERNPIYKQPAETTTYSVQSVQSACGTSLPSPAPTATVTVMPGMVLDDLDPSKPFCELQIARLHFISSIPIPTSSMLTMEVRHSNGETKSVPVTREGDFIRFNIPAFSDYSTEYLRVRATFTFQLVCSAPALRSLPVSNIAIQSKPQLIYPANINQFELDSPTNTRVYMEMTGGGPYDVVTSSGLHLPPRPAEALFYQALFIGESTEFGIKSVQNACFTNSNLPKAKFTVKNPNDPKPFISVLPVAFSGCHRDSLELDIQTSGIFNSGNIFQIQITQGNNCCNYETIASATKAGKIKIKIPGDDTKGTSADGMQNFNLRVASTHPEVIGTEYFPSLSYPIYDMHLDFSSVGNNAANHTLHAEHRMNFKFQGAAIDTLLYSDGSKDHILTGQGIVLSSIKINPQVGSNTFTIKKVTTVCGPQQINLSKTLTVMPYRILMSEAFSGQTYCPGSTLIVPFVTQDGSTDNAIYSWQLKKQGEDNFQTIFTDTDINQIRGVIPSALSSSSYISRISTQQGPISNEVPIKIGQLPTATLTFPNHPNQNPINIENGERLDVRIDYTGSFPIRVVNQYQEQQNKYSTPETYFTYPAEGLTYQLKTVSNACGFGPPSNAVQVNVKPALDVSWESANTICAGGKTSKVTYQLKGDADLSNSYIYIELVEPVTGKRYILDSTKTLAAQRQQYNLPSNINAGNYELVLSIPKYGLKQAIPQFVHSTIDATLFGDMTIVSGDTAGLAIKLNQADHFEYMDYVLSDGSSGRINSAEQFILVNPAVSTTYRLLSISSICGAGKPSGSAEVTVLSPSENSVRITNWHSDKTSAFCTGDTLRISFETTGNFTSSNRFTIQLSDASGQNFKDIPTTGNTSPLTAIIPSTLPPGAMYRLRAVASDPASTSSTYRVPFSLHYPAKAKFGSSSIPFHNNSFVSLPLVFEGDSPWFYTVLNTSSSFNAKSNSEIDSLRLPNSGPTIFTLLNVRNVCGAGLVEPPSTLIFEQVLGWENPSPKSEILIFPNPFTDYIHLDFQHDQARNLRIYTGSGIMLEERKLGTSSHEIHTSTWAPGPYLLTITTEGKSQGYKIWKR